MDGNTPPTPTSAAEPLVSDHDIREAANAAGKEWLLGNIGVPRVCKKQLVMLRDQYEAKLDEYQAAFLYYIELAERNEARIAELQSQLDAARARERKPMRVITQPDFVIDLGEEDA